MTGEAFSTGGRGAQGDFMGAGAVFFSIGDLLSGVAFPSAPICFACCAAPGLRIVRVCAARVDRLSAVMEGFTGAAEVAGVVGAVEAVGGSSSCGFSKDFTSG